MPPRACIIFPAPASADATGLVAISAHMDADLLLAAYRQGLFPWACDPVRWYSPDPRAIFGLDRLTLPTNLPKLMRRGAFRFSYDCAFGDVIRGCAAAHAAAGAWITETFVSAYSALHARGHAHSVEVWQNGQLVGGLYGVQVGGLFAGESMFHRVANASKAAFWALAQQLVALGITLVDAQVPNPHTRSLGVFEISRAAYLERLAVAVQRPTPGSGQRWPACVAGVAGRASAAPHREN